MFDNCENVNLEPSKYVTLRSLTLEYRCSKKTNYDILSPKLF